MSIVMPAELPFITQTNTSSHRIFIDGNHQYVVELKCEVCQSTGELIVCACQHFFYCSDAHRKDFAKGHGLLCRRIQRNIRMLKLRYDALVGILNIQTRAWDVTESPLSATRLTELLSSQDWQLQTIEVTKAKDSHNSCAKTFFATLRDLSSRFCLCVFLMARRNHSKLSGVYHQRDVVVDELRILVQLDELTRFCQRLAPFELDSTDVTTSVEQISSSFHPDHRLSVQAIILAWTVKTYGVQETLYMQDLTPDNFDLDLSVDHGARKLERLRNAIRQMAASLRSVNEFYWQQVQRGEHIGFDYTPDSVYEKRRMAIIAWQQTSGLWLAQPSLYRLLVRAYFMH